MPKAGIQRMILGTRPGAASLHKGSLYRRCTSTARPGKFLGELACDRHYPPLAIVGSVHQCQPQRHDGQPEDGPHDMIELVGIGSAENGSEHELDAEARNDDTDPHEDRLKRVE